jgi:leucyl aminopeptidase
MFLNTSSSKTQTDYEFIISTAKSNLTTNKNGTSFKIYIDTEKPFTSIQAQCQYVKHLIQDKTARFDVSLLPIEIKTVFMTYVTKELYQFEKYKTRKSHTGTKSKYILIDKSGSKNEINELQYIIQCVNTARDIQNEPANMMSPETFCKYAKNILQNKAKIKILNVKDMVKEGLNLVLAIGRSSLRPPRFFIAEMIIDKTYPTICVIGKTVVYDAGGLNIKGKGMTPEMKTDKTGGAVAISIMKYFAKYPCTCNIVILCPVVENILSQDVIRPGDVIKAHNGVMVEIIDTDAEGRLLLADALSFSKQYNPTYVIDFATLTGWADSLHPDINAVCWTRNISIASIVNQVGENVGERVWFLPHWDEYTDYAKSNIANVKNDTNSIHTGAYYPVMFMLHFLPDNLKAKYIHFDICHNWKNNMARGNCVHLGIELIKKLSKKI